jgi:transposase
MTTPAQDKAQQRATVIMQVRAGQITATEAARILGVSRKTYYEWERRGLEGMLAELADQPPGRPMTESDPEKEALKAQLRQAEAKLEEARQVKELREILDVLHPTRAKKNSS